MYIYMYIALLFRCDEGTVACVDSVCQPALGSMWRQYGAPGGTPYGAHMQHLRGFWEGSLRS